MQIIVTHGSLARTRVLQFSRWQIAAAITALALTLVMLSGTVYHFIFLKAAREGWPLVSPLMQLVVRDELAQQERVMRDNLDAMAQRVGEIQAKLVKLEAVGERVSGAAGIKPEEFKSAPAPGKSAAQGGPFVPLDHPSQAELREALAQLDARADLGTDLFTLIESRLLASRLQQLLVPSVAPVDGPIGSGFGFRPDPISGRSALHTGLDFPADVGTSVVAAAGGLVLSTEWHNEYGQTLEIDHGRGLLTRYAHLSKLLVKQGDLVKRGQRVAEVGNTGRSTGAHLHFEVHVEGVPQDPARFLDAASLPTQRPTARR